MPDFMLPSRFTPFALLLSVILGVAFVGHAQRPKPGARARRSVPSAAAASPEAKRRLEAFNKAWQTISDHYFDKTYNNLNWTAVKAEFEPRARSARTDAELHRLISEMINRLGSSHLAIIEPEVYEEIERAKSAARARLEKRNARLLLGNAGEAEDEEEETDSFDDPLSKYGIGIDLRIIDDQFVITRIEKNSAAQHAGLKTGFVIEKINDLSLPEMLLRLKIYYRGSRALLNQVPTEIVTGFINGEKDTTVELTYLDGTDSRKEIVIPRELLRGQAVSLGTHFPEDRLEFESYELSPGVGYIRFSQFAMPVIEKFCSAVYQFRAHKGIIIDLRGNSGGIIASAVGLSGMLSEKTVDLGTSIYKHGEERLISAPKAKNFKGRVVFLVDETTASAAEMFAVSFQETGRAVVVGERTAGATLPSVLIDLPTGAVMQYPIANYRSGKGAFIEGKGVTPDLVVPRDRKTLAQGIDPQLEKARAALGDDKLFPAPPTPKVPGGFGLGTGISAAAPPPPPPPRRMDPPPPSSGPPPQQYSGPRMPEKVLAEVTIKLPPPPPDKPKTKDPAAVKVIEDFIALSGGRDAISKLERYEVSGKTEMTIRGTVYDFAYAAFKGSPDKYAEVMSADGLGEIREVFNGRSYLTQADYGLLNEAPLPPSVNVEDVGVLAYLKLLSDESSLTALRYSGTYERDGRKVHLIEADWKAGSSIAFAFDVENKTLTYYTGPSYGLLFGDYRKVGDLLLPFSIERERLMKLKFESIKVNQPIDESRFVKKINCYDVPN